VDSTQEVQILTADYAAEYGRSSGAQIRVTTKTGTNQFHGAAYEYLRNTALNANTWARNANPVTAFNGTVHYNQFGYNIGGPFYIPTTSNEQDQGFPGTGAGMAKYHFVESGSTLPSSRPAIGSVSQMRQGDFSELLDPNNPYITRTNEGSQ